MDFENPEEIFKKFQNCCISARKCIDIWVSVYEEAYRDYKLKTSDEIFNFLLNSIDIVSICRTEYFNYNPKGPPVYGYLFLIRAEGKTKGYLGIIKLPPNKGKYKWTIKSLHKDQADKSSCQSESCVEFTKDRYIEGASNREKK
jgi:hypothetical protein